MGFLLVLLFFPYIVDFNFFLFSVLFFLINYFILFIYFWLCSVFVAAHGLSLVAVSGGCSSLWCAGFSLRWLLVAEHRL